MLRFSFMYVVMSAYIIINLYLFVRLSSVMSGMVTIRAISCALFVMLALMFPLSRFAYSHISRSVSSILVAIGSIYLAPMAYAFIFTLAADAVRIINKYTAFAIVPPLLGLGCVLALTAAVCVGGAINMRYPTVIRHTFAANTQASGKKRIKIGVMSDLHFGRMIGIDHLEKVVSLLNEEQPDIILMPGDIIDDLDWLDDEHVRTRFVELFASLTPRLGIWASTGNHEFYAGADGASEILGKAGVGVLRDAWIESGKEVIIIGREDRAYEMIGAKRKTLANIAADIKRSSVRDLPILLMDHQPVGLDEASSAGIAFQASGHTHRGQMWPINMIVARMFECSYGPYEKAATRYYVSSGAGTWGPPVRTTGRPEVAVIEMDI